MLELGCGTGAVIAECQRRALGREFTAIDYSSDAIEFLASRSKGIRCIARDITDPSFVMEGYYDVGIVSHVIEHLENPLAFLRAITQKMRMGHLVLEVPLEDLSIARWKAKFRDRAKNLAGHVQFFTEATFRQLVESSGLEIVDGRTYSPVLKPEVIDFVCRKDGISGPRAWLKMATGHYLLRATWARYGGGRTTRTARSCASCGPSVPPGDEPPGRLEHVAPVGVRGNDKLMDGSSTW